MRRPAKEARKESFLLSLLALAAVLALSGCGGGGDEESATATGETTSGAEAERKPGEAGQDGSNDQDSKADGGESSDGSSEAGNAPQAESERESEITPEQEREATKANITLESPAFAAGAPLKARYTCDGENTWPALQWKGLPAEVGEIVLLVLSIDPVKQTLLFDWAVAGLDPSLTSIEESKLPDGAVVGENSFGEDDYNLCPAKGQSENYIFMLFAIPEALDPEPGFDAKALRSEVLAQHGNVGLLNASYQRK
jgi:phosphatidylethanolamine-binding protein (PEBP) family uncharacterized protein